MWNGVPAPASVTSCSLDQRDRLGRVERLDVHGGEPDDERAEQPADAADVGEREHHRVAVGVGDLEPLVHARARRPGSCGRCAARPSGRRWCPTCRSTSAPCPRSGPGGGGSVDGSPCGQGLVGHQHLERAALGLDRRRRCPWPSPRSRSRPTCDGTTSSLLFGLAGDEADLALAVDRQHRVLDGAEAGQREHEHLATRATSGSCHDTTSPAPIPWRASPAAARSASVLASAQVSVRPSSSTAASPSGVAAARRSTSSQRLPPSTFGMLHDPRRST